MASTTPTEIQALTVFIGDRIVARVCGQYHMEYSITKDFAVCHLCVAALSIVIVQGLNHLRSGSCHSFDLGYALDNGPTSKQMYSGHFFRYL